MEHVDEYKEKERYFMQHGPWERHGTGTREFKQQEGAGGDGCHVDEYENMVQELEPDGGIPYPVREGPNQLFGGGVCRFRFGGSTRTATAGT